MNDLLVNDTTNVININQPAAVTMTGLSNYVRVSNNVININPIILYIKEEVDDAIIINNELTELSKTFPDTNLLISKNQDPQTDTMLFTSKNAYVPYNNALSYNTVGTELLKQNIFNGINEILATVFQFEGTYKYEILNSWMQQYASGVFLSPHNHESSSGEAGIEGKSKIFSIGYYIDDGDPDLTQSYSGVISFVTYNHNLTHVRPRTGTLLIWEDTLVHLVNPFYSKSNKMRFMLSANIKVYF
jgi:hypothetical protein